MGALGGHILALTVVLLSLLRSVGWAVNLDRYHNLTREELLALDRDVTTFYLDSYEDLDNRNATYDQYLFKSIRSIRHTMVLTLMDFTYTSEELMQKSQGSEVDLDRCKRDLSILHLMAEDLNHARSSDSHSAVPISAVNLLESSGRAEAGVLNGNINWLGSTSSCLRAKISAKSIERYLKSKSRDYQGEELKTRYCVAHLRARSWPQDDIYFGDRISLKVGLCLPRACHSMQFLRDESVREIVDYLARAHLVGPFNSLRYNTSYLYCLPDEDSPFRSWDLGMKLFCLFSAAWLALLLYTNLRYHRQREVMRKLRESVDIRMVISRSGLDDSSSEDDSPKVRAPQGSVPRISTPIESKDDTPTKESEAERNIQLLDATISSLGLPVSRAPSANPTPLPSDIEENDGEFNAIRPAVVERKRRNLQQRISGTQQVAASSGGANIKSQPFDFNQCFSIGTNVSWLFQLRREPSSGEKPLQSRRTSSNQFGTRGSMVEVGGRRVSGHQQLGSASRRASAMNESLIKEIQQQQLEYNQELDQSLRGTTAGGDHHPSSHRSKRVNVDILDGIKVLATSYIVTGHTMMFYFGSASDLRFGDERMMDVTMTALINALQVVGLFYIITGALFTFLTFTRGGQRQIFRPSFWIFVIASRYMRLIPSYLLVFWFARHVAPHLGSGPLWQDYRTDSQHVRGHCASESWITMLTMSAADVKIPYDCVPQTWYLSNDFRTLLVLPPYIVLLALNQTAGYVAIAATFCFSSIKLVSILTEANIDYKIMFLWQPHVYSLMADRLHDVYTDLVGRLSTYLLGVCVGHLLYLYETRQIRDWPPWFRNYGMKFALLAASVLFTGNKVIASPLVNQFLPHYESVDATAAIVGIICVKCLMEICICMVLMLLVTGGGFKWLRDSLASNTMQILSRLSYGVFLVHVEVMYKLPAIKFESSYWYLITYTCLFVVTSNLVALVMHVLYEMPINNILRHAMRRALALVSG